MLMPHLMWILDTWKIKSQFLDWATKRPTKVISVFGMRTKIGEIEMTHGEFEKNSCVSNIR